MKQNTELDINNVTGRYTAIMQMAERLFGEKGYRGVSIEEIATAAGVSKSLVLYHFTSKKALLERIVKDSMTAVLDEIETSLKSGESVKQKIRAAVEAHLRILTSRPHLLRIAFFEGIFGDELKEMIGALSQDIMHRIGSVVQEGIDKGEFKPVETQIAMPLLMGMTIGLPMQAIVNSEPQLSVSRMADEITELFCQGLRP